MFPSLSVSVIKTTDVCSNTILESQSGYIATPRYPSNYPNNQDCLIQIRVNPSQKINLTIMDMDLEINGTYGCHDWMYAYDQFLSVTLCGRRGNERLNSLQSNEISIKFQSDQMGTKKGFWLYYEGKKLEITFEPPRGKTNNMGSEQVRHKPACTVTETG